MNMHKDNPLGRRAAVLQLNHEDLAARTGLSLRTVYNVIGGETSLSVNAAERLARPLRANFLALLVTHALWRRSAGRRLTDNERGWIQMAETSTGLQGDDLARIGLVTLGDLFDRPPDPPSILLKGAKK